MPAIFEADEPEASRSTTADSEEEGPTVAVEAERKRNTGAGARVPSRTGLRVRPRGPTEYDVLVNCLGQLKYSLIAAEIGSRANPPRSAPTRFKEIADDYRWAARWATRMRRVIDVVIKLIEIGAPFGLLAGLLALQAPMLPAAVAVAAAGLVLFIPYIPSSGFGHGLSLVPWLFVFAVVSEVLLIFAGTSALFAPADPHQPAVLVLGLIALTATALLVVLLLVDILRRHRRSLVGYFLMRSPRHEIVCELVLVVHLLREISAGKRGHDQLRAVAAEKLERVVYLFRTGAPYAGRRLSVADWRVARRQCRGRARELHRHIHHVGIGGLAEREEVDGALRRLAAEALLGEKLYLDTERRGAARLRELVQTGRVVLLPALTLGAWLLFSRLEPADSPILTVLTCVVVAEFYQLYWKLRRLVGGDIRELHAGHLVRLVSHFPGFRRHARSPEGSPAPADVDQSTASNAGDSGPSPTGGPT